MLPNAHGDLDQLNILCSPEDRPLVETIINDYLNEIIYTPQPEKLIDINWVNPWDNENWETKFNVMLISLKFPEDSTADLFSRRFLKASNTNEAIFVRDDVYANDQLFFSINVQDAIQLQSVLKNKTDWIKSQFLQSYYDRLKSFVYSKGLNNELMDVIQSQFGFKMDIQEDFIIVNENQKESFLWLGRIYPYRWITIHKLYNDISINNDFWEIFLERITATMPQIYISEHYRIEGNSAFNKSSIPILRGIYDHEESNSGGPFFSYLIKDSESHDNFLISGFVNYPGHKKLNLLNQLEILIQSINFSHS